MQLMTDNDIVNRILAGSVPSKAKLLRQIRIEYFPDSVIGFCRWCEDIIPCICEPHYNIKDLCSHCWNDMYDNAQLARPIHDIHCACVFCAIEYLGALVMATSDATA